MTLGKSFSYDGILAKEIQLGWWLVPIRGLPLLFAMLGIFRISDHGGSWIKMISNWFKVSRRVLMMREFLWTFCEKILRFFTIIIELSCSLQNELIWICFHGSQCTSSDAIPYWICVSKMDIGWSLLGGLLDNLSTWTCEGIVLLFLFPILAGWFWHLSCSTSQIPDGVQICVAYCIWCI